MRNTPKGSQTALFTDVEVRRDYLKSKQWVEQHMCIKVHLTGFACAYENLGNIPKKRDPDRPPKAGRVQGSLYNQQKHAIADAVEWIRQNSRYKPRIFVATTPGFLSIAKEGNFISKLVHNLSNGYGMEHFVWVREYTKKGFPHYHFVADVDEFDPVRLSLYWSKQFGVTAKNSIRLGTKPNPKTGRRDFWIKNQRMCWYMTKYIGKALGEHEKVKDQRRPRSFHISKIARAESQPLLYRSFLTEHYSGFRERQFMLSNEQLDAFADTPERMPPHTVNPRHFSWRWTGHGQTFVGFLKDDHRQVVENSQKFTENHSISSF